VLILSWIAAPAPAREKTSSFERHEYTNEAGSREYLLYVPSKLKKDASVVVYLHGCTQTADDAALGTRFNELAEERGFLVVYPEQDPSANGSSCWNWFLPEHQHRDAGEPSIIAGITKFVADQYRADPDLLFVLGASAGGAMSANMAASYPDLYAAAGILAAPAYGGTDTTGDLAYAAMGEHARAVPVVIFQGTADLLVNYALGRTALTQWLGTDDLADDGARNGSVSMEPEVESRSFDQSLHPGAGDPCVPPPSGFPCAGGVVGFQDGYPHTIERYRDASGGVLVEFWSIHGLGHAFPYGNSEATFTDPLGPDVRTAALEFFLSHPKTGV
jgi:poly(hydroxyalkanoate) depolymerase family esterase